MAVASNGNKLSNKAAAYFIERFLKGQAFDANAYGKA